MDQTNVRQLHARTVHVDAQGHFFRLKMSGYRTGRRVGGPRGTIERFTAPSRKRMLQLLARIDVDAAGFVAFVTLTYPDRDGAPSPEEADRDRQTFLKRIGRAVPEASAIWRREWEERKSGDFEGVVFPHYHMLFFGLPFLPAERLNAIWKEVLGHSDYVRTEIKGLRSWRQAFAYVAKYMGKPGFSPAAPPPAGGVPTASRKGDAEGGAAADRSLVYGAYLTAEEDREEPHKTPEKPRSVGRAWGVFGRKCLPMAKQTTLNLPVGRYLEEVRRLAKQQWEGVGDDPTVGFSLFVDNPEQWAACMAALVALSESGEWPEDVNVLNPVRRAIA